MGDSEQLCHLSSQHGCKLIKAAHTACRPFHQSHLTRTNCYTGGLLRPLKSRSSLVSSRKCPISFESLSTSPGNISIQSRQGSVVIPTEEHYILLETPGPAHSGLLGNSDLLFVSSPECTTAMNSSEQGPKHICFAFPASSTSIMTLT